VPGRVEICPHSNDPAVLARAEALADKLLALLPETPVTAFGINFRFSATTQDARLRQVFAAMDDDKLRSFGAIEGASMIWKMRTAGSLLTLNVERSDAGYVASLNHHHAVSANAGAAREPLRGAATRAWKLSGEVMKKVFE
jgi:hypothetical protein